MAFAVGADAGDHALLPDQRDKFAKFLYLALFKNLCGHSALDERADRPVVGRELASSGVSEAKGTGSGASE